MKTLKSNPNQGLYAMTSSLMMMKSMAGDDKSSLKRMVEDLDTFISKYRELQKEAPDAASRAYSWHEFTDELIDEAKKTQLPETGRSLSCKKGCSWCCGQVVNITKDEAILLFFYAKEKGIEIDWNKVDEQIKQYVDEPSYGKLPWKTRSCVFLDQETNSCKVYEHRPSPCRTHYSVGEPSMCNTEMDVLIEKFVSYRAEVVTSASWNVQDTDSLPEMLKVVKNENDAKAAVST